MNDKEIEEIKKRERKARDEEAPQYCEFVESVYGRTRSKAYTHSILNHMKLCRDENWLDAGSGVGRLSLVIAPKVKKLICVDHSLVSLHLLKMKIVERGLKNISVYQSCISRLPFKDEIFNGIILSEVLQHIPSHDERFRAIMECYRSLLKGGKCIVNVVRWKGSRNENKEGFWGKNREIYRYYFTANEIRTLMGNVGFNSVSVVGFDILHPKLCNVLPTSLSFVDKWISQLPFSAAMGNNLIAIGIK